MASKYNSDKFDSCLNTYREKFSNINQFDPEQQHEASIIMPLDFSLEMDGISGIIPNSAFEVPAKVLPNSYLTKKGEPKIAFILHTIEQNFNNNKWTTTITGQTLHIRFDPLSKEEIKKREDAKKATPNIPSSPGGADFSPIPTGNLADFWSLVAISAAENYTGNPQGVADVAQSIYNRLGAQDYGNSVKKIVVASGQYEPTFKNRAQWLAIKDKSTAVKAYQTSKGVTESKALEAINNSYNAIQNVSLMESAKNFVGSRTEFLAEPPSSKGAIGVVQRNPSRNNNAFYWQYAGKTKFYNPKNKTAKPALPKPTNFMFQPNQ